MNKIEDKPTSAYFTILMPILPLSAPAFVLDFPK